MITHDSSRRDPDVAHCNWEQGERQSEMHQYGEKFSL
jgi:hypothetical protein